MSMTQDVFTRKVADRHIDSNFSYIAKSEKSSTNPYNFKLRDTSYPQIILLSTGDKNLVVQWGIFFDWRTGLRGGPKHLKC